MFLCSDCLHKCLQQLVLVQAQEGSWEPDQVFYMWGDLSSSAILVSSQDLYWQEVGIWNWLSPGSLIEILSLRDASKGILFRMGEAGEDKG